jgi:site-specific recombinase XerD
VAFAEHQRLRGLSPVTIDLRARTVRRLAAWLDQHRAGRSLSSVRLKDLRAFVASRRDQIASSSQASEISYVKSFYKGLLELGLLERNPAVGLKSWRPHTTRRPISLVCVRALLLEASRIRGKPSARKQAVAQGDRACLELLFATGMRASEVVATRAVDLDLDEALVLVRRAKGGVSRRLPLPAPTLDALRAYLTEGRGVLLGERPDPGSLFLNQVGGELTRASLQDLVGRVAKRAEVHAYPHAFRRTLATELVRAGVNLPAVQKVLGHAQLTMTATYVDVREGEMRAGLEAFARDRPKSHVGTGARLPAAGLQSRLFPGLQLLAG